jgi:murein DD-endopeptidase MepM/ murein hydrolase activator NlpD
MLISPPFLVARGAAQTEDDWIAACMNGGAVGDGGFPVSAYFGWHGGLHLNAPMNGNVAQQVRAIADGTVVYVRQATPRPTDPAQTHAQMYRGQWTDNGVVIIRHDTEIGEGANGKVSYFSIYMHLSAIESVVMRGRAIYRKSIIGNAGRIYGTQNQIHFEIVCDDTNLQRMAGRITGDLPLTANGRNTVFGQVYFRLPTGTHFYAQRPALNQAAPTAAAVHTSAQELIVGLRYAGGDGAAPDRGDAYLNTMQLDGTSLGAALNENDAEYNLYISATGICNAYPEASRPVISAVYEMLRYGRVLGPDALNPTTVPHWRQVRYPGGQGWVNLNATGIHKFSDADFPQFKGWKFVDDDSANADCRCDSAILKNMLRSTPNEELSETEIRARSALPANGQKFNKTICKFPTEWDASTIDAKWGWLKSTPPDQISAADFELLRAHITAMAFWQAANLETPATPASGNTPAAPATSVPAAHWHFHPREFIRHFRTATVWSDLIRRWRTALTSHTLPSEDGLSKFGKTALYEYALRSSKGATKNHQDQEDLGSFRALDDSFRADANRRAVIFGMRVETNIDANQGKGEWDDRVTVLKRDETKLLECLHSGLYTTEPSGYYLAGGRYQHKNKKHPDGEGKNVGGTSDKDIGRLVANRTYEYAPSANKGTGTFGALRFGTTQSPNQFNILKKTVASFAERLVTNTATLPSGVFVSSSNTAWQTGTTNDYSEERTMYFHKGYGTMTGSAGCQTFPSTAGQTMEDFMKKLEPMDTNSRFQYVLTVL